MSTQATHNLSDAFQASGTSPTVPALRQATAPARIHLIGPGSVGRALLRLLSGSRHSLVAVTDSKRTLVRASGLDPLRIADSKSWGHSLESCGDGALLPSGVSPLAIDSDIVVDASASAPTDAIAAFERGDAVLRSGRRLAVASKHGLARVPHDWLRTEYRDRFGCNAALGGVGRRFQEWLPVLRQDCDAVWIGGNASTTTILQAIEGGAAFDRGVDHARREGVLEPDPEQDFRGDDAAIKLAIVLGALRGRRYNPDDFSRQDLRELDPQRLRSRAARGETTRLIGRFHNGGGGELAYQPFPRESGWARATAPGRVRYGFHRKNGEWLHLDGDGIGAEGTARALWEDVERLAGCRSQAVRR